MGNKNNNPRILAPLTKMELNQTSLSRDSSPGHLAGLQETVDTPLEGGPAALVGQEGQEVRLAAVTHALSDHSL